MFTMCIDRKKEEYIREEKHNFSLSLSLYIYIYIYIEQNVPSIKISSNDLLDIKDIIETSYDVTLLLGIGLERYFAMSRDRAFHLYFTQ